MITADITASTPVKNLDRVMDLLKPATERLGEDEMLLKETYNSVMSHRANWFRPVVAMVGGVVETRSWAAAEETASLA